MASQTESKTQSSKVLEPINVAYGLGAAVVITGVMAKFLNFPYANTLLFIGLATEAIVFAISAFEFRKVEKEYNWEKVFPQLKKSGETNVERVEELIEESNLDPQMIERLTKSIERLEQNVEEMSKASDTAKLADHFEKMKAASENFESEISRLNDNINKMNEYYESMLEVMSKGPGSTSKTDPNR